MKVFLTGITGYIGQQLGLKLAEDGIQVHGLVRDLSSDRLPVHPNIKVFQGDICDYDSVRRAASSCRYTFHTAAFTDLKCSDVKKFYCNNVTGTKTVLEASLDVGVEKVVHTSTLSVFGSAFNGIPITETQPRLDAYANDYELTKSMSEEVVREYVKKGLPCVILNVTRVFGPGLRTYSNGVNKLIEKLNNSKYLIVPDQLDKRANYVFIDDVINAHIKAAEHGKNGERYIIGGINIDYNQLFESIKEVIEKETSIYPINYTLLKYGIISFELFSNLIGNEPRLNRTILESLFTDRPASSKKAIDELGYRITPLETGLRKTVEHIKNH